MLGTWAWVLLLASAPSGLGPRPSSQIPTLRWLLISSATGLGSACLVRMLGEFIDMPLCLPPLTPMVRPSLALGHIHVSLVTLIPVGLAMSRSRIFILQLLVTEFSLLQARNAFSQRPRLLPQQSQLQQCRAVMLIYWAFSAGIELGDPWCHLSAFS